MPHYAIGDVQGCYAELMALLEKIDFNEKTDTLWFAGDLINGGLDNLSVLRFISQLPKKTVVTLGNHDLHLLAVFYKIRKLQFDDTFEDILNAPDAENLCHWLQSQSLAHYDATFNALMIHAGVSPFWSLQETLQYANEIQTELNPNNPQHPENVRRFLMAIFSIDHGEKQEHWRLITDTLTRVRFYDAQGNLNLRYKGDITNAPAELYPWFDCKEKNPPCTPLYKGGDNEVSLYKRGEEVDILFGHWAALEKQIASKYPHLYALDTGCAWGGMLSALRIEDKQWFQIRGKKYR